MKFFNWYVQRRVERRLAMLEAQYGPHCVGIKQIARADGSTYDWPVYDYPGSRVLPFQ